MRSLIFAASGLAAGATAASAATLCVNPNPRSGCAYKTIGAAVSAAKAGDTINVAPGRYAEDVHITQPVALIGAGARSTVINAKGLANGIFIDGINGAAKITPGSNTLTNVTVSGFTVQNANFEGILALNAANVTLWGNLVTGNDRALQVANSTCPGLPDFETSEGDDCGEGIHLIAVDHSTVVNNTAQNNAGGILLSDETGPTNANVVQQNEARDNVFDCGITLASHPPAPIAGSPSPAPFGVYDNTIADNEATANGTEPPGGAGVGLYAPGPHNATYGNVVVGNRLTNNGLPGVAIHNHAPTHNIILSDNVVTGNYIAGNGPDSDVPTTVPTGISLLGTTAVSGTLITLNQIEKESIDIAINNAAAQGAVVVAHLNNLVGRNAVGVDNLGAGPVDATENWWGCATGPGARGCSSVKGANVTTTPFLTRPVQSAGTALRAAGTD
ncbi:MAG TPA: right-handed parallel beta-helix repeat-containing protein [Stellaceae bacterium]